ncbi:MAG: hypothetical protein V4724_03750 [Pseudomonadota bacterium]
MLRKQLLYLTSERLCAYQWEGGALSPPACFTADRQGLDAFMEYLEQQGRTPVFLLADLIEEDFQRQLLPHVGGKAGRALVERRLLQQYRETPYRQATFQGRSEQGRRDDIALFSALTNPAIVQPWTEALELLKVPLAGVYSAALLGPVLVDKLGLRHAHLLLVTQHSGGLRQSYFQYGELKFSRLTPAIDRDGVAVNIGAETDRTQQFLNSIRLLERGDVLDTVIVAPAAQVERLSPLCLDGPETVYHFMTMEAAATRAGLRQAPELADALLLHLLGSGEPISHYRLRAAGRYYSMWRTRLSLFASSAVIAACALTWVGGNLWGYADADADTARLNAEAQRYRASYRASMASMPPAIAPTANMRAAVTVERMVSTQGPGPLPMLVMLGAALDKMPQIRIARLDWQVRLPDGGAPARAPDLAQSGAAEVAPMSSLLAGIPLRPPQSLRVEAEVQLAQNDYRNVLDSMNQFAQELARQPGMRVEVERPVLDVRPSVKLSGKTESGESDHPSQFVLNLVLP